MRLRRAAMSALALVLLYGNAAVALGPPPLLRIGLTLPATPGLRDAFLMTGMFSSYTDRNNDFLLAGERTDEGAPTDRKRWIRLPLREHFPSRHGVTYTQLFAAHHWDVHGPIAQRRAWGVLAAKIRARHNRLHPDHPVRRVRLGAAEWPISPMGYRALKTPDNTRLRTWYTEPTP